MTAKELKEIIAKGKNERVEIKYRMIPTLPLAMQIVALGNTDGGMIIIGAKEKGAISGIDVLELKNNRRGALRHISGNIKTTIETIDCDGKIVGIIHVDKHQGETLLGVTKTEIGLSAFKRDPITIYTRDKSGNIRFNRTAHRIPPKKVVKYIRHRIVDDLSEKRIAPCFEVDKIAESFANLLRQTSGELDNICFFGVFGPWGRGKSFFLNRLRNYIKTSEYSNQYDFINFNAWKYQETPAIWAHLIHTLINHKPWWSKGRFWITRRLVWITLLNVAILLLAIFFGYIAFSALKYNNPQGNDAKTIQAILAAFGAMFSLTASSIGFFKSFNLYSPFGKKEFDAQEHLGIQHQSEKELVRVLSRWNWWHSVNYASLLDCDYPSNYKKKPSRKVVLVVEDLDRCSEEKMLSSLEALKLVMENPKISKRMIVIVAIDSDKLINAYKHRLKGKAETEKDRYAFEQLNKIFLMGIKLPRLKEEDLERYVDALVESVMWGDSTHASEISEISEISENKLNKVHSGEKSDLPFLNSEKNDVKKEVRKELSREESLDIISITLKSHMNDVNERLSPRQLKILFYRLELANNLLCDYGLSDVEIIFDKVIEDSLGKPRDRALYKYSINKIIEMVTPYLVVR